MSARAERLVAEMADLGAVFTVSGPGPDGLDRWTWEPRPESMRTAIRKVLRGSSERPSSNEMVAAIRRLQARGAA